jgi:DNA-binding NtrC family response regulator
MIRILLVEDEEALLKRMKQILEKHFPRYEIHAVSSGNEARKKLKELRTMSLVVLDYFLGDENGYQLLEFFQSHLTDVPVIIISAYGKDEDKEVRAALSFQKGAFDFMHKPLDFDEFVERIKHALYIAEALA